MRLGIFAKTFRRPSIEATLDAVKMHGLSCVQWNMACAGLPTLPDAIDPSLCDRVADAMAARGLMIAAVSGTYNMIHPELERRRDGLRRLGVLAAACRRMGASVITLCTGTRDRDDMWRWHPSNTSWAAWEDLMDAMHAALAIAEEHEVTLAIEPELANIIDSAAEAVRLFDRLGGPHPRFRVVIDPANLFREGDLPRMTEVLEDAFARLGPHLAIAHAKDLDRDGAAGDVAAGKGRLDYDLYLGLLRRSGFDGPLILHGLDEAEVPDSVAFLRRRMAAAGIEVS